MYKAEYAHNETITKLQEIYKDEIDKILKEVEKVSKLGYSSITFTDKETEENYIENLTAIYDNLAYVFRDLGYQVEYSYSIDDKGLLQPIKTYTYINLYW